MGLEAAHVLCEAKMALVRVVAIEYGECDVVHQDQQEHDRVLVEPAAFEGERNEPNIRQEQNGDLQAVAGQEGGVHEGAEEVARDDGGRLVQVGVDQHVVVLGPGEQDLRADGQVVLRGCEEEGGVEFSVEGPHSAELVVVDEAVGGQAINNKQKECADCEDEVDLVLEEEVAEDCQLQETGERERSHVGFDDGDQEGPPVGLAVHFVEDGGERLEPACSQPEHRTCQFQAREDEEVEQEHVHVDLLGRVEEVDLRRAVFHFPLRQVPAAEQVPVEALVLALRDVETGPVEEVLRVDDAVQERDLPLQLGLVGPVFSEVPELVHEVGPIHEEVGLAGVVGAVVPVEPKVVQEDDQGQHELGSDSHRCVFECTADCLGCLSQ